MPSAAAALTLGVSDARVVEITVNRDLMPFMCNCAAVLRHACNEGRARALRNQKRRASSGT